jgi:rhodanese-related sulfurtransferase
MILEEITVQELARRQENGEPVFLLDVRRPEENQFCALPDSVLIPLQELPNRLGEIKPEGRPIVVYCHHGVRSLRAAGILVESGYSKVYSLSGGIDAWSLFIDRRVPRYG